MTKFATPDSAMSSGGDRSHRLARVLQLYDEPQRKYSETELRDIFQYQMVQPVTADLSELGPLVAGQVRLLADSQRLLLKSFADLLNHPSPPLELLVLTKDFAKANREAAGSFLPKDVATVLYYAAIAVALVRCYKRITELKSDQLAQGLTWAVRRPWIDAPTREIFDRALKSLSAPAP